MTYVGRTLNLALVVALLVLAAGTVGATVLYQSGVADVEAQNEQLRAQNEQLREDLQSARDRVESLRSEVQRLKEQLDSKNETLTEVRAERDGYREDLRSVCRQVSEGSESNESLPEECENVEWE